MLEIYDSKKLKILAKKKNIKNSLLALAELKSNLILYEK